MMYRASFNGLSVERKGVYNVYNITSEEYMLLYKKFNKRINGSKGNYTIYDDAHCYLWLKLLVHDQWKPIKIDIRDDFLKATNSRRIYEADIKRISKILTQNRLFLYVSYDPQKNTYALQNKDSFLTVLAELLKQ